VSDLVRDKDGVTAALVFAALVVEARDRGETVWDRLEAIARRHGLFATQTWSFRFDGPEPSAQFGALMRRLRSALPQRVGERQVLWIDDLLVGGNLPPTDAIALHLDGDARVIVRPSGTEPKVKAYARVVIELDDGPDAFGTAEARATALLGDLRRDVSTLLSA
jgi:phosphomannomutase